VTRNLGRQDTQSEPGPSGGGHQHRPWNAGPEIGGNQADALSADLVRAGYVDVNVLADEDGDTRAIEAALADL
jgi:hypothetical protein